MAAAQRLALPAPAKVNLFLHVTGRRADGYHTIESLFALVDLADFVSLRPRDDGAIVRAREVPGVAVDDDLTLRAARALQSESGSTRGVSIELDKRIPVGSGLGGGSSDAASVLLGLNRLWELQWTRERLASVALTLGADVPFFIAGDHALARGVGELLVPVTLPTLWLVLATPSVEVSTAVIFAAPELTRDTRSAKMDVFSEGYGRNDLEPVAVATHAPVAEALDALRRTGAAARMTGSGGCVYAGFAREREAIDAAKDLPPGLSVRIVRTLARHPLATFA